MIQVTTKPILPLTPPMSLSILSRTKILNSVNGLLCFCGRYGGFDSRTNKVVIWNPALRKSVVIRIPIRIPRFGYIVVGFGVCPASDPKLVMIIVDNDSSMWEVHVFTLSTRLWIRVYMGAPFKSCCLNDWKQVFVDGVVYFRGADDDVYLDHVVTSNSVISFDFKSEMLGEVCLPERLVHTPLLRLANVNESLGLLEYYDECEMSVCGVWMMKDGANKTFSKIYTVKVEGKSLNGVLAFRNNGEVVMELKDDDNYDESRIEVSGHTNGVGINGETDCFSVWSYMETLLLLDESESVIYY
ncbi:putative pentatricopeptide repeat-containing protein [Tanacetum coccineum]